MSKQRACENCQAYRKEHLIRLGIGIDQYDYIIALAGNPNTGKSTVFNNLTGLRQHTGNWPGKTVTRAEGGYSFAGKQYKLVDLPGTYSLLSTSKEEEVARDFILFGRPDVTVIVADATRLERNLNLVLQILEITDKAVLCLNLMDEAERNHITINERTLSKALGIPVVTAVARQKKGMDVLINTIENVATGKYMCKPHRVKSFSPKLDHAVALLVEKLSKEFKNIPNLKWVALRLLEGDQRIIEAVRTKELGQLGEDLKSA
ncbi:ferrous iron transport protein B [Maribacter caenipelagi]|uniref:Ferrous iron transport protein B n=1 Tax=Maribacter caenipelagi TaxID=1447781 RepID=A0A4R7D6R5_9FLAO|nr:ferrous iron transport protein B [Maribacter caenipelagi]